MQGKTILFAADANRIPEVRILLVVPIAKRAANDCG
jgi:hypothetical protein